MCRRCFTSCLSPDFKFYEREKFLTEESLFRLSFASGTKTEEVEECVNIVLNDPEYIVFVKETCDPNNEMLLPKQFLITATAIQFLHKKDEFLSRVVNKFVDIMAKRTFPINHNPCSWTLKDTIKEPNHLIYYVILEWLLCFVCDMKKKSLEEILSLSFVDHYLRVDDKCKIWILPQLYHYKEKGFFKDQSLEQMIEKLETTY